MATGDAREWAQWLGRHGPALLLLARQWVPSRADAEDAVQDGCLRFWRSREKADDPAAYLYACVRSAALDFVRGGRRRGRREQAVAATEVPPAYDAMFTCPLERRERRTGLRRQRGIGPERGIGCRAPDDDEESPAVERHGEEPRGAGRG